jgi:hypothetical protein
METSSLSITIAIKNNYKLTKLTIGALTGLVELRLGYICGLRAIP